MVCCLRNYLETKALSFPSTALLHRILCLEEQSFIIAEHWRNVCGLRTACFNKISNTKWYRVIGFIIAVR